MRVMIVGATLAALAACSSENRLLAPDHEADKIVSKHKPDTVGRGVDPVCGAHLDESGYAWRSTLEGEEYYFDSEGCKLQFEAYPDLYRNTAR